MSALTEEWKSLVRHINACIEDGVNREAMSAAAKLNDVLRGSEGMSCEVLVAAIGDLEKRMGDSQVAFLCYLEAEDFLKCCLCWGRSARFDLFRFLERRYAVPDAGIRLQAELIWLKKLREAVENLEKERAGKVSGMKLRVIRNTLARLLGQ